MTRKPIEPADDIAVLDFDDLMERLGVGFSRRESHGEMVLIPDWTTDQCLSALEIVRNEILPQNKPVLLKKHPARWIYCSIINELKDSGIYIARHDGGADVLAAPRIAEDSRIQLFPTEENNEIRLRYKLRGAAAADRDYEINFGNLGELSLPPLAAGKHLFIKTLGSSAVPVGMCLCYGGSAASIWVAEPDSSLYMCALSNSEEYQIGCERKLSESTGGEEQEHDA